MYFKKTFAKLLIIALLATTIFGEYYAKNIDADSTVELNNWQFIQGGQYSPTEKGNEGYINYIRMNNTNEVIDNWLTGNGQGEGNDPSIYQTNTATAKSDGFYMTIGNTGWDASWSDNRFNPWSVRAIMPSTQMSTYHLYKVSFKGKASSIKNFCITFHTKVGGTEVPPYDGDSLKSYSSTQTNKLETSEKTYTYYFTNRVGGSKLTTILNLGAFNFTVDYYGNNVSSIISKEIKWSGSVNISDFQITDMGFDSEAVPTAKPSENTNSYKLKNPEKANGVTYWDSIYFGSYPQSSDGNGGYKTEPIKWRVLNINNRGQVLLLSDKILDTSKFYPITTGKYDVKWAESELRSFLNNDFYNRAFNDDEKSSIIYANLDNHSSSSQFKDEENTNDRVFVLSYDELTKDKYGFDISPNNSNTRQAQITKYARRNGAYQLYQGDNYCGYWSRNRASGYWAPGVSRYGAANNGACMYENVFGVRPAIIIDPSKENWTEYGTIMSSINVMESHTQALPTTTQKVTVKETTKPTSKPTENYYVSQPTFAPAAKPTPAPTIKRSHIIIKPSKVKLKKVKVKKNKVTVKWKRAKYASGYQVKVGSITRFTNKKTLSVKVYNKRKVTVKVRAYNLDGARKAFGSWSKKKKVKVKYVKKKQKRANRSKSGGSSTRSVKNIVASMIVTYGKSKYDSNGSYWYLDKIYYGDDADFYTSINYYPTSGLLRISILSGDFLVYYDIYNTESSVYKVNFYYNPMQYIAIGYLYKEFIASSNAIIFNQYTVPASTLEQTQKSSTSLVRMSLAMFDLIMKDYGSSIRHQNLGFYF